MSTRGVNINFETTSEPRVLAWFDANGIDPHTVPVAQEVLVTDDHLAYVEFMRGEDGKLVLGGNGYLKQIKVIPLISAPENHGL